MAMKEYPRKRNGDEYYPPNVTEFVSDEVNGERYARDRLGNELYPNRRKNLFVRNNYYQERYARDRNGNEYYPRVDGKSSIIERRGEGVLIATMADGTQRYPTDKEGNEYYLKHEGRPFLLRQPSGDKFLAKSRRGSRLIPWNHLIDYAKDETPYLYCKDSGGNGVYIHSSELPRNVKFLCDCICRLAVLYPGMIPCCCQGIL